MKKYAIVDERTEEVYTFSNGQKAIYESYGDAIKMANVMNRYSMNPVSKMIEAFCYMVVEV